jgi:hypothetical protein
MIPEYLISFDTKNLIKEKVDFLIVGGGYFRTFYSTST